MAAPILPFLDLDLRWAVAGSTLLALVVARYVLSLQVHESTAATSPKGKPMLRGRSPYKSQHGSPLVLHGFAAINDVASSGSGYVSKVETFLRLAGLEYEVALETNPQAGPKDRMPFITHGDVTIGDSFFIVRYLSNTFSGLPSVKRLKPADPAGLACAAAAEVVAEEILGQASKYFRFVPSEGFALMRQTFSLPWPLSLILLPIIRKRAAATSFPTGFERHSREDQLEVVRSALHTISELLGADPFLAGETPCAHDASVFAFLDIVVNDGIASRVLAPLVCEFPNLMQYVARVRNLAYPAINPGKLPRIVTN